MNMKTIRHMNDEKTRNSYGDAKVILYFRF